MKLFISTVFILCCLYAFPQKCKFDYEKEDKMTNKMVKRIDLKTKYYHHLSFYNNGEILQITETIIYRSEQNEYINEGAKLKIKLNNDSVIELLSTNVAKPSTFLIGGSVKTKYIIEYTCEKDVFELISKYGFAVFSYQPKGKVPETYELNKKSAAKSAQSATCILQD